MKRAFDWLCDAGYLLARVLWCGAGGDTCSIEEKPLMRSEWTSDRGKMRGIHYLFIGTLNHIISNCSDGVGFCGETDDTLIYFDIMRHGILLEAFCFSVITWAII